MKQKQCTEMRSIRIKYQTSEDEVEAEDEDEVCTEVDNLTGGDQDE
jgi:hypothetical protein